MQTPSAIQGPRGALVAGGPVGSRAPLDPRLFINRELSWLEFNQRVLDEAADPSLSMPDRLRFLGIVSSNLDEFFMVRVAGLKVQIAEGVVTRPADGMAPAEQLAAIGARVHRMVADQYRLWRDEIRPGLARECGIRLARPDELGAEGAAEARRHFREKVYPLLTPLANDRSHPFPQLRNKSISLAVQLPGPGPASRRGRRQVGTMAVVGVPTAALERLVPLAGGRTFVLVEDLIAEHVGDLFFSGLKLRTAAFRVTRNWDLDVDLEEGDDLVALVSEGVRRRDLGAAVRLEFAEHAPCELTHPLAKQHQLSDGDVYAVDGPLQLQDLAALADLARPEQRERRPAAVQAVARGERVVEAMARGDLLLHHPYDSFDPVVRFIEEAADDPDVKAIKQVLYRTGQDSPFIRALQRAAEQRKEVAVFLEIRARLDEENNIGPIEDLKRAGAMVVYGYDACKTHCKVSLVVRDEGGVPGRYVHVGTGNYNPQTARCYTDVSLLTARPDIADEVEAVFHMLTGNTVPELGALGLVPRWPWRRLAVAPHGLKERVLALLEDEVAEAAAGRPARVLAKMNSLVDREVIAALYRASQAGVPVDLLVRGICCLRPGVPGVSERIRVHQVVDRYLEHSRIFAFGEGKRARAFISSADWMPRNFHSRVEVMAPVDDPAARARVLAILEAGLADTRKGSRLRADGTYERCRPQPGAPALRSQELLEARRHEGGTAALHSV